MEVLFYSAHEKGATLPIMKWAQQIIPPKCLGICRSLPELESRLRQQSARCKLAIFHISAVKEIDRLILMKNLLEDIRIILIVPNVTKDTVQKGHQLYPRFMADANIGLNQLAAVIQKNLAYLNIEQSPAGCGKCCALSLGTKGKNNDR
jgi:hypothetical protein